MVSNVKIASTQMIKPSSPTPDHLRILKLSFLDQLAPPVYTPLVFFYDLPSSNRLEIHQSLKQSLSNVLTQFYPLAGRLQMKSDTVDCNDSGVLFVEANIHANLMDIIKDPTMDELKQYLPLGPTGCANTLLLAVQMNVFDCGGIAVAVQISHKIADATSAANFMNAWAAVCRGAEKVAPEFDLAKSFPPKELSIYQSWMGMVQTEKTVTKRFVFDKEEVEMLKLTESTADRLKNLTRVEAISSFFLRRFMDMARARGSNKLFAARHAVNLRPRMDPPLPDLTFGNAYTGAIAVAADHEELVGGLRDAIRSIDGDYVKNVLCGDEYLHFMNSAEAFKSLQEVEMCSFSSWLRVPLYEVDYGWGRPAWVSTATFPYKNLVFFMGTSSGDGVEAWVNLLEEDAADDMWKL